MAADTTSPADDWHLICLCAQWCGTCREWRPQLAAEAARHPGVRFEWVDIEDQADAVGDVDVETFPTLLIAQGDRAHFLGPVPPSVAGLTRLLASLRDDPRTGMTSAQADALLSRLKSAGLRPV